MGNAKATKTTTYRDLVVWRKAIVLANTVYSLTDGFPKREHYGLGSQMRRAAVSVPSNLAEGQARGTTKEFLRYIRVARGSLAELDTQLVLSGELGLTTEQETEGVHAMIDEIQRMLYSLGQRLQARIGLSASPLTTDHSPLTTHHCLRTSHSKRSDP